MNQNGGCLPEPRNYCKLCMIKLKGLCNFMFEGHLIHRGYSCFHLDSKHSLKCSNHSYPFISVTQASLSFHYFHLTKERFSSSKSYHSLSYGSFVATLYLRESLSSIRSIRKKHLLVQRLNTHCDSSYPFTCPYS
jgi:hypothetical protein